MIFRKGPRISQNMNCFFDLENIQIINSCTDLGVEFTYKMSFKKTLFKS